MIKIEKYEHLSKELKELLTNQIDAEFGHVPFVQQHHWAKPDWAILKYEGDEVATFYHVVERDVTIDGKVYRAAGINNVITPSNFRGRGYASQTLKESMDFLFQTLGADMGILLCADALLPFYSRLNWYKTDSVVYYDQPGGLVRYDSNTMLLMPADRPQFAPKEINLNGLPW